MNSLKNKAPCPSEQIEVPQPVNPVFHRLEMLSKGSGLFRVKAEARKAAEKQALEKHPWRARLEAHLQQASEHGADWIYFRLECDAGGPKPEIFIYDRTSRLADGGSPSDVAKLHHDL